MGKDSNAQDSGLGGGREFAETRWTLVRRAAALDPHLSSRALEELCSAYWYPLYAYVRRNGRQHADAQDLTQAFFEHLLRSEPFGRLSPERGRFRSFLLRSMENFLANDYRRLNRQKRGGKATHLSIDWHAAEEQYESELADSLSPDRLYDQAWASTLLNRCNQHLAGEWAAKNRSEEFALLEPYLDGNREVPYDCLAGKLNITANNARQKVDRVRKRFRELLVNEIAQTCDPEFLENEMESLLRAFGG